MKGETLPAPPPGALIIGIDEAGRGPLAGPVIAAAVHLPPHVRSESWATAINDSKALSPSLRETLDARLRSSCLWGTGAASVREIEEHNILAATFLAMTRAALRLASRLPEHFPDPDQALHFLVDGPYTPDGLPGTAEAIVGGDALHKGIAAASILAKCCRDRAMERLSRRYADYGFDKHKGYGTAAHRRALEQFGATPHHRRTFAPVRALLHPSGETTRREKTQPGRRTAIPVRTPPSSG